MKKLPSIVFIIIVVTSLISTNALASNSRSMVLNGLISGVSAAVTYGDWLGGSQSTLDIRISGLPANAGISNGTYVGWCIQPRITGLLHGESATLYSSLDSKLPSDLSGLPWNQINYVLNHKIRGAGKSDLNFHKDVQTAIWLLLGDTNPEFGISSEAQQMFDNAQAHPDYSPGYGDLFAVVVYSDGMSRTKSDKVQEAVIEVPLIAPTSTPTGTPTNTPATCQPTTVEADFRKIAVGESVEGMGVVVPNLNIDAKGTAISLREGMQPATYGAPNDVPILNGSMAATGGFSDLITKTALQPHEYTFTFAPNAPVSSFSVHMLDYGDLNLSQTPNHYVSMTAYDANNSIVTVTELSFLANGNISPQYGDLALSGDAVSAQPGQPGNWTWNVFGSGIVKVVLSFGDGYDSNIGFDKLSFVTECEAVKPTSTPTSTPTNTPATCQPTTVEADFRKIAVGESVEGMGVVVPNLNIDAKGTAISLREGMQPATEGAPNDVPVLNGGMAATGGFSDLITKTALQPHEYTFTFAPNAPVSSFSVHMLDYGDLNLSQTPNHYVSMTAYDANNSIVAVTQLAFLANGNISPQYGDLVLSGDAVSALPGQPGNWTWNVFGSGIVKVVLSFGDGYDPNIAFDKLSFVTECQPCALVKPNFSSFIPGSSVEGMGVVVPNLNIDAKGTAISLRQGIQPATYGAPNDVPILNGGMVATGGFSDLITKTALQPHAYIFTFAPNAPVSSFSVHMLDYGDLNPTQSPIHFASMTAYDANNNIVSVTQLAFFSNGNFSPQYGDLALSGDAVSAQPGQPGNWTWNVYGSGIVKVVLNFGEGYDPNVAFDILSFCPQSP